MRRSSVHRSRPQVRSLVRSEGDTRNGRQARTPSPTMIWLVDLDQADLTEGPPAVDVDQLARVTRRVGGRDAGLVRAVGRLDDDLQKSAPRRSTGRARPSPRIAVRYRTRLNRPVRIRGRRSEPDGRSDSQDRVDDSDPDVCNEGAVDGTGEQDNGLHQRWPGIGLAARRSWRREGRPDERGRGGACRAGGSARRRPGPGPVKGDAVQ